MSQSDNDFYESLMPDERCIERVQQAHAKEKTMKSTETGKPTSMQYRETPMEKFQRTGGGNTQVNYAEGNGTGSTAVLLSYILMWGSILGVTLLILWFSWTILQDKLKPPLEILFRNLGYEIVW